MSHQTFWVCVTLLAASAYSALAQTPVTTLQVENLSIPSTCDSKSATGDTIQVHYVGKLTDGSIFDESKPRGKPFGFRLGQGQVIKGWDQGLQGMCVGEQRQLTIPSHLAYGDKGFGDIIPPGATLSFFVELLKIN